MLNLSAGFGSPFRIWFFSGTLMGALLILPWVAQFVMPLSWQPLYHLAWWHHHEMIYGFAVPFIMGFLLTASQNWTGEAPITRTQLVIITALWWLARLAIALAWPVWVVWILDVVPIVVSALLLARVLIRNQNYRNLIMVFLLLVLAFCNSGHLLMPESSVVWARMAILTITTFIAVLGGRVIPFFTANALGIPKVLPLRYEDKSILVLQFCLIPMLPIWPQSWLLQIVSGLLGGLYLFRVYRWFNRGIFANPLLWSLHLAYAVMALSWLLIAIQGLTSLALHALTVGVIALMILALSGRVSLGHSGRPLAPTKGYVFALITMGIALTGRVIWPLVATMNVHWVYLVPGVFWSLSLLSFLFTYFRVWWSPRADGRPG